MDASARDRYFDAATQASCVNAEEEVLLRQSLEQLLPEDINDAEIDQCSRNLRPRQGRPTLAWIGIALVLLVSLPILSRFIGPARQALGIADLQMSAGAFTTPPAWTADLSTEDSLYCFGDTTATGDTARWQALWDRHPGDPVMIIHRILVENNKTGAPNENWVKLGQEVDPANGWFALHAAASGAKVVAELGELPPADREAGIARPVTLHDETELARRIAWFHQAAGADVITSRQSERLAKILEILGPAQTWQERAREITAGASIETGCVELLPFSALIVAEANRCVTARDNAGFRRLCTSWETTMTHLLKAEGGVIEGLVARAFADSTLPSMRDAAANLGVDPERWSEREVSMRERRKKARSRPTDKAMEKMLNDHGSMFAHLVLQLSFRLVDQAPPLTAKDLEPGCRGDQAFLARGLVVPTWLLLGIGLLPWLGGSRVRRRLAGSCVPWTRADTTWLVVAGVLLPVAGWWVLRTITPWGRLDVSPWRSLFIGPAIQFLSLWLLLLATPLAVASWRLGKSAKVLGFATQAGLRIAVVLLPWLALGLVAAALPIHQTTIPIAAAAAIALIASLVLSCLLGRRGSARREGAKWRRTVLVKTTRPAWWCGLACLALLVPLFELEERHWIPKDSLLRFSVQGPEYEAAVARVLARETATALDLPDPTQQQDTAEP